MGQPGLSKTKFRFTWLTPLVFISLNNVGGRGTDTVSMGLWVGDCTRGSAEKCVRQQLCFLVPTLDCQVFEINGIIFLDS